MKLRNPKYRGLWEGECLVDGCSATCVCTGEWLPWPHSPQFFCATDGELPGGWLYQHPRYIYHTSVDRGLYCPTHAPAWREYRKALIAWNQEQKTQRKTWWLQFKTLFTGDSTRPTSPYETP